MQRTRIHVCILITATILAVPAIGFAQGFIENRGQFPDEVLYYGYWAGGNVYFTSQAVVFDLRGPIEADSDRAPSPHRDGRTLRRDPLPIKGQVHGCAVYLRHPGAGAARVVNSTDFVATHRNIITSSDPQKWSLNAKAFSQITYKDVVAGVDITYSLVNGALIFEVQNAEGVSLPREIFSVRGAQTIAAGDKSQLQVTSDYGDIAIAFEEGSRETGRIGFHGAQPSMPLAAVNTTDTDPSRLVFSTMLGGPEWDSTDSYTWGGYDHARGCDTSNQGDVYVCGETSALVFPTTPGAYIEEPLSHDFDAFVARLEAPDYELAWCTLLRGSEPDGYHSEYAEDIVVDRNGDLIVVGVTSDSSFPIIGDVFTEPPGTNGSAWRGFVMKLDSDDGYPLWSALIDGAIGDSIVRLADTEAGFVAVDDANSIVVGGSTNCATFYTTPGSYDPSFNSSSYYGFMQSEIFVLKIAADGSAITWGTYLGAYTRMGEMVLDSADNVVIGGQQELATGVPELEVSPGAYDDLAEGETEGFVAKLRADGSALEWCTYLGTADEEEIESIVLDAADDVLVAMYDEDFPSTPGAYSSIRDGSAVVVKLAADGESLLWATGYGSVNGDPSSGDWTWPRCVRVDGSGQVYLAGRTGAQDLPMTTGPWASYDASVDMWDIFIAVFDPDGASLRWSTYLGGSEYDPVWGRDPVGLEDAFVDSDDGVIWVVGFTPTTDWPITDEGHTYGVGPSDAYVSCLDATRHPYSWSVPSEVETISAALDAAVADDRILVAPGTYAEHGLVLKDGVVLESEAGPLNTIIDAGGAGRVFSVDGVSGETEIRGFTITGGAGVGVGGGIYLQDASLRIKDCIIRDNSVVGTPLRAAAGAGIYCGGESQPTIENCTIVRNTSGGVVDCAGTAIYCSDEAWATVKNCIIAYNSGGTVVECEEGVSLDVRCSDVYGNEGGDWIGCTAGMYPDLARRNLHRPPRFCDAMNDDYSLRGCSPCSPDSNLTCGLVGALGVECSGPATWYIKADGTGDVPTIEEGVVSACPGDTVLVGEGTYYEHDIVMRSDVTVMSESGPEVTVIDAQLQGRVMQCVDISNSRLDGFTVTGGGSLDPALQRGAGLYCDNAQIDVVDCVLRDNYARGFGPTEVGYGGALYCTGGSVVDVTGCTFYGNKVSGVAGEHGSAIYSDGSSQVDAARCVVAYGHGGEAMYGASGVPIDLDCCVVYGNEGGNFTGCVAGEIGVDGNRELIPGFCDLRQGDLHLVGHSPCAFGNSPERCGQIGALGVTGGNVTLIVEADGLGDAETIGDAMDFVVPGDSVLVHPGTYNEHDIPLAGGVPLIGTAGADETTITPGGGDLRVLYCEDVDSTTVIKGFTIAGGSAVGSAPAGNGGGLYCLNASPRIEACVFANNAADYEGGAVYCDTSDVVFEDCTFQGNEAASGGGAISCLQSSPRIVDCLVDGNTTSGAGGGLRCQDESNAVVNGCTFSSNAAADGGGMHSRFSTPSVTTSLFLDNTASAAGGGLKCYWSLATISGVTFDGNSSATAGGGIDLFRSDPEIDHVIISSSTAGPAISCSFSSPAVSCSNIWQNAGGDWVGCLAGMETEDGNMSTDPLYCDLASDDYHLQMVSPCADDSTCGRIGALGVGCAGNPNIDLHPTALNFATTPEGRDEGSLQIGNSGGTELVWVFIEREDSLLLRGGRSVPIRWLPVAQTQAAAEPMEPPPAKGAADPPPGAPVLNGSGGGDAFGYRWIDSDEPGGPVFDWIDITSIGTELTLGDDDSANVYLPMAIPFYGVEQTNVRVCSNGYLLFDVGGAAYSNRPIPSSAAPNCIIAPFWDDLDPTLGGTIHHHDDKINKRHIIQYTDVQHYGGSAPYTFQVHLYTNGTIVFQYLAMQGSVTSATVGIEDRTGTTGLQIVYNAAYLHDGLAIRIEDAMPWLAEDPPSGTVAVGGGEEIGLVVEPNGLAPGQYSGTLQVNSTDPGDPEVLVPVSLLVRQPTTIRVPLDMPDIASALGAASSGDTVLVAPGTYLEYGLVVESGVYLVSEQGALSTIIDAQQQGRALDCEAGDDTTRIEGFTITGGSESLGGGIEVDLATLEIVDCVLQGNTASGGGAVNVKSGSLLIRNSTLFDNEGGLGSAIFVGDAFGQDGYLVIENSIISHNVGSTVGPVYHASNARDDSLLVQCTDIYGNEGGDWTEELVGMDVINGNQSIDPMYCDPASGLLTLDDRSPCAPAHSGGCGLIGALAAGCGSSMVILPASHELAFMLGQSESACDSLQIVNEGEVGLNWTISESCSWVDVTPVSGSVPASSLTGVEVCVDGASLEPGQYLCDVIVNSDDQEVPTDTVRVALDVHGYPNMVLQADPIVVEVAEGASTTASFSIANDGEWGLTWFVREEEDASKRAAGGVMPLWRSAPQPGPAKQGILPKGTEPKITTVTTADKDAGGADAFGYRWSDSDDYPDGPVFTWEDISGTGTPLALGDDDYVEIDLPFDFPFYGAAHSRVKIASNGYLTFGPDGSDYYNDPIPTSREPNDLIAAFWDDLDLRLGGSVTYSVSAEEGRLLVQYTEVVRYGTNSQKTFQVELGSAGVIDLRYLDMNGQLESATVGIEGPQGAIGLQVAANESYLHDHLAVRFQDAFPWITQDPPGGVLPVDESWDVMIGIDASDITRGSYAANLVVESNDPDTPLVVIPLSISVRGTRTWYVPGDAPTIAGGLDLASAGDTVIVAAGTYPEHDLQMVPGVVLRSQDGPASTIIDAQQEGRVLYCFETDTLTQVEGFTLRGGQYPSGAGAMVVRSDLQLVDCTFEQNVAATYGGGLYVTGEGLTTLEGCAFIGNSGHRGGGGAYCNDAVVDIQECAFTANRVDSANCGGGALKALSGAIVSVQGTEFRGNWAELGGAVRCVSSTVSLESCSSFADSAVSGGMLAVYDGSVTLDRSTLAAGNATINGAGVYLSGTSSLDITNSIIAFSSDGAAVVEQGTVTITVANCDIYGNEGGDWVGDLADDLGQDCNIATDPLFCDLASGDLTLRADSPCLAGGHPDFLSGCTLGIGAHEEGCGAADLELTKTVDNMSPSAGDTVTFIVVVLNQGPSEAHGVTVLDQLPDGYALVDAFTPHGTYDSGSGLWQIGSISWDSEATLHIDALVLADGEYGNVAQVWAAGEPDPDSSPGNDDGDQSEDDEAGAGLVLQGGIVIDPNPDAVNAPWDLTGPASVSGSADSVMTNMPLGTYTLTWGAVDGWAKPMADTQELIIGGSITFTGQYSNFADVSAAPVNDPGGTLGVAWGDYDADGWVDLYVSNIDGPNRLLRNETGSAGVFADMTTGPLGDSGQGHGVGWGDYDNDGDLDLYIANTNGPNRLLRNEGAGLFVDVGIAAGVDHPGNGYSVLWGDYDNDSYLDLFLCTFDGDNILYTNQQDETFLGSTDGPYADGSVGPAEWCDYDNDGDIDLYTGIWASANHLCRNDNGTFVNVAVGDVADPGNAYGVAWGDYDNDGDFDIYLSNLNQESLLLRNDGGGSFVDVATGPLSDGGPTRGAVWGDYDNDGYLDLFVAKDGANRLLRNIDGSGTFVDVTAPPLDDPGNARTAAWADYDNDGDLDLYIANYGSANILAENRLDETTDRHWLHVDLIGQESNRGAVGARVEMSAGGMTQIRQLSAGSGWQSQGSARVEFGLGATTVVDSVHVKWPSGLTTDTLMVAADQVLTLTEERVTNVPDNVPSQYALYQCYPNPFNPETRIRYDLPHECRVSLRIYDLRGVLVAVLVPGETQDAGRHELVWRGRDISGRGVATGVYFYRMEAGSFIDIKRMVLMK